MLSTVVDRGTAMTHFAVLVITESKPTHEELEAIMMPWYASSATPYCGDQYINFDWTAEVQAAIDRDGLAAGLGAFRLDDKIIADEAELDRSGPHQFGAAIVQDGRLIKAIGWTSPDPQWDFWNLGGRFTGRLAAGYEPWSDPENMGPCRFCGGTGTQPGVPVTDGCDHCDGTGRQLKWESEWRQFGNQSRLGDVDVAAIREVAAQRAAERYDAFRAKVGEDAVWESIKTLIDRFAPDHDAAWKAYQSQAPLLRLSPAGVGSSLSDNFLVSRNAYVQKAREQAFMTRAVIKDGRWHQRKGPAWIGV